MKMKLEYICAKPGSNQWSENEARVACYQMEMAWAEGSGIVYFDCIVFHVKSNLLIVAIKFKCNYLTDYVQVSYPCQVSYMSVLCLNVLYYTHIVIYFTDLQNSTTYNQQFMYLLIIS